MAKKKSDEAAREELSLDAAAVPAAAGESGLGFEAALERLEAIVAEMEAGALPLETLMARFEEGRRLVRYCGARLNEVERKIEILVKEGETTTTRPFDPAEAGV